MKDLDIQEIIKSIRQNQKKTFAKNDYEIVMDAVYDSLKNRTEEYLKDKEFMIGDIKVSNFSLPDKDYLKEMFNNINNQNSEILSKIKQVESSVNYFETNEVSQILGEYEKLDNYDTEKIKVLSTLSVHNSSLEYWNSYSAKSGYSAKTDICWTCLGYADAVSAFSGAQWGGLGGPAGVFAGALSMGIFGSAMALVADEVDKQYVSN